MLTKSLSRSDYNKEKKVAVPKTLQRVISQVSVRSHLIQPTENIVGQIKRYIQSQKSRNIHQISHLDMQPCLHTLQVRIQDLNRLLANRDDEITELKNEKQKEEKKIEMLNKNVFDLKTQLQKSEYQYKTTIDFLRNQNITQKTDYLERITFLEDESKKFKQSYQNLLKNAKEIYDLRIKSFSGAKQSYKLASEEVLKGLKRDIHFHIGRNNQLKNEMFQSGNEKYEKLKQFQEENYSLKQRLEEKQLQYRLLIFTSNSETDASNFMIKELNDRIEQMLKTLQKQRQNFIYQKQYIEKVKREKQAKLRQNLQNLLSDKMQVEVDFRKVQLQLTEVKYQNQLLDNKCIQLSTRIELSQLAKKHQIQLESQISSLKKFYEQKIISLDNDLECKNRDLIILQDKVTQLTRTIKNQNIKIEILEDQNTKITILEEREKICKDKCLQLAGKNQALKKQSKSIKEQIQTLKLKTQQQIEEFRNQMMKQKNERINQMRNNHKSELKSLRDQNKKDNKQFFEAFKEDQLLNCEENFLQKIPQSVSDFYDKQSDHQIDLSDKLKQMIHNQADILLKNESIIQKLQLQNYRLKSEKVQKQVVIQQMTKQKKKQQVQFEKIKTQAIDKYTELREKSQQVHSKLESQNYNNLVKIQKTQNQIENLQTNLYHLQLAIINLENQNKMLVSENFKLKQALYRKQQNATELMNQLEKENKQNTDKIIHQLKIQNTKHQQSNQIILKQIGQLKEQKLQLLQAIQKTDVLMIILDRNIQEKKQEIKNLLQKVKVKANEITLLQQRLDYYQDFIASFDKEKQYFEAERKYLQNKLSSYEIYLNQLRTLKIYDIYDIQAILKQNNTLKIAVESQRMEIQYQAKQNQQFKVFFHLNKQRNIEFSAKIQQKSQNFQQQKEMDQKINAMNLQFQIKNRKLIQKIDLLSDQLNNKQHQLKSANILIKQSQQNNELTRRKLAYLENSLKIYQRKVEELSASQKKFKEVLVQKQLLILTLRSLSKQNQRKDVVETKQYIINQNQLKSNISPTNQQIERKNDQMPPRSSSPHESSPAHREFSPRKQIQKFKAKVERAHQIRDEIIKSLKQKQRQTVRKVQHRQGSFLNVTTGGCLDQIEKLLQQIKDLKNQNARLVSLFITYRNENQSRASKFKMVLDQWKQCNTSIFSYDKELTCLNLKWRKITQKAFSSKDQQNKIEKQDIILFQTDPNNNHDKRKMEESDIRMIDFDIKDQTEGQNIKIVDFNHKDQMEEFEESFMIQAPFFPKTIPRQNSTSKLDLVIESIMGFYEETVKKQNNQLPLQTVQTEGRLRKQSIRYEDEK